MCFVEFLKILILNFELKMKKIALDASCLSTGTKS